MLTTNGVLLLLLHVTVIVGERAVYIVVILNPTHRNLLLSLKWIGRNMMLFYIVDIQSSLYMHAKRHIQISAISHGIKL